MSDQVPEVYELWKAKTEIEYLTEDLSGALHLLYAILLRLIGAVPPELRERLRGFVHAKILQLPQGCRLGRELIEMDDQFGGLLESQGIWLRRWVYIVVNRLTSIKRVTRYRGICCCNLRTSIIQRDLSLSVL